MKYKCTAFIGQACMRGESEVPELPLACGMEAALLWDAVSKCSKSEFA